MKNAIILHGLSSKSEYYDPEYPTGSNSHWLPWLQKHLMIHDVRADTPEVPFVYEPKWPVWAKEVERFDITSQTTLIGHSMGGGFWVGYLSKHPDIFIDKLVLVAPWTNVGREKDISFFDFEMDPGIAKRVNEIIILNSDDDRRLVHDTVAFLQKKLPSATIESFHGYGHFTLKSMKTSAFPELLDIILR